jgi:pimeloyl-ACP methyl ester carboxylesterase
MKMKMKKNNQGVPRLIKFLTRKNKGESPPRIENWRQKDDPELPSCVKVDESVPILETPDGTKFVRTPDERFENLPNFPFKPNYVEVEGLRVHYVDEGPADGEVVLMLHGQPSWSYLYRKMIPIIAGAGYRAIAMDHIGMGRSDKPIDMGFHRFEHHVEIQKKFIEALSLQNITIFVQDWGSLIGLRVAGDLPEKFARIIVANGTLPVIAKGSNPFRVPNPVKIDCSLGDFADFIDEIRSKASKFKPRAKFLKKLMRVGFLRFFQRWILYSLTHSNFKASQVLQLASYITLSPEELAAYDAPFPSHIYKAAPRTFPSMVAGIEEHNKPAWENLGKYTKPFLFLGGEKDFNMGKMENQILMTTHIPGAEGQAHERYDHAAHFIQDDEGEKLGHKVVEFCTSNPI